jgi:hypothetical protein
MTMLVALHDGNPLTRMAMVAAMTTNTRLTHTAIHHGDHLSAQGSLHGGYRHGRRRKLIAKAKPKHRYLLPKGVPKLSERNSADHAAIVSAMNAGRISKQREQHMYNRETKLSKRELEAQRTAIRVKDLGPTAKRRKGAKPNDLTTLGKLEVAFPEGPLRNNATSAHYFGIHPTSVGYTRKGMSELLVLDHDARTQAAFRVMERNPAEHLISKCKWDETKQRQSDKFSPLDPQRRYAAIQD